MSNRILAFLILLGFGGAIYAFYLYFYVYYKGDLEISSNLSNYTITLYSDSIKRSFTQNCETTKCLFTGLPPVEYVLSATASGYIDVEQNIKVPKNKTAIAAILFKKKITLESISEFEAKLSVAEKIERFKENKLYKLVDNEAGVYEITRENNTITLLNENREKIGDFEFTGGKKDITLHSVRGNNNIIWLKIGSNNYLYHAPYKQLSELAIIEDIQYIKNIDDARVAIITKSDTYYYTPHLKKLENLGNIDDMIELDNQIFSIKNNDNTSVIYVGNKKVYESSSILSEIYIQDDQIYLVDTNNNSYLLKGVE